MCVWDGGYGEQPESEREQAWRDSDDADYGWNDGVETNGEEYKESFPGEGKAGPEYWLNKGMEDAEDDDEKRRYPRRRRRRNEEE